MPVGKEFLYNHPQTGEPYTVTSDKVQDETLFRVQAEKFLRDGKLDTGFTVGTVEGTRLHARKLSGEAAKRSEDILTEIFTLGGFATGTRDPEKSLAVRNARRLADVLTPGAPGAQAGMLANLMRNPWARLLGAPFIAFGAERLTGGTSPGEVATGVAVGTAVGQAAALAARGAKNAANVIRIGTAQRVQDESAVAGQALARIPAFRTVKGQTPGGLLGNLALGEGQSASKKIFHEVEQDLILEVGNQPIQSAALAQVRGIPPDVGTDIDFRLAVQTLSNLGNRAFKPGAPQELRDLWWFARGEIHSELESIKVGAGDRWLVSRSTFDESMLWLDTLNAKTTQGSVLEGGVRGRELNFPALQEAIADRWLEFKRVGLGAWVRKNVFRGQDIGALDQAASIGGARLYTPLPGTKARISRILPQLGFTRIAGETGGPGVTEPVLRAAAVGAAEKVRREGFQPGPPRGFQK